MKKLVLLVLGFVMFKMGYSQYPIQQYVGADSAVVTSKGGLQGRLINTVFTDTASANLQRIRQYPGAMIYAGGKMWVRNTTATGWVELAYGPISTTNIYNSDGTLTGNRELDGNGYTLDFTAVRKFQFSGDSLYYLLDPAGNLRLKLGNQQFTMQGDTASLSRRLSYTGNLGSSFTKHSLIDKNYVDSVASLAAGTVTSVATNNGTGITGGTITSTGTLAIDTLLISTRAWRQKGIDSVTSLINARPSGSGTTNYLSKWTSSSALGNSLVFDNGTQVLVNTTTADAVNGLVVKSLTNSLAEGLRVYANNQTAYTQYGYGGIIASLGLSLRSTSGNTELVAQGASSTNTFGVTGNALRMFSTGNVVIGYGYSPTDAGFRLDVSGTFRSTGDANINGLTVGKGGGSVATNTAVGFEAINATATGGANSAFGYESVRNLTSGARNVGLGYRVLRSITTGQNNTGLGSNYVGDGSSPLFSVTTGSYNTALGSGALYSASTTSENTAVGYGALGLTTASFVTAVGSSAGYNSTGNGGIFVGRLAGLDVTTGTYNTIIGSGTTGNGITTGSFNTIIGSQITGLSSSLSNTIILADGQGNQRLYINNSGNVGIGTTSISAGYRLEVAGSTIIGRSNATAILQIRPNNGYGGWIQITEDVQGDRWTFGVANNSGTLRFGTGSVASNTARVEYFSNGNVGIGVSGTDAGYKLDVNGTSRFQSTINVNMPFTPGVTSAINFGSSSLNYGTTGINMNMGSSSYNYGTAFILNRDYTNTGTQVTLTAIDITNNWTGRDWDALATGNVYGIKISQSTANMPIYGGRFDVTLTKTNPTQTAYGVYASATITGTGNAYSFYGAAGTLYNAGNVGIGTTSPSYRLDVAGNFRFNNLSTAGIMGGATNSESIQFDALSKVAAFYMTWTNSAVFLRAGTGNDLDFGTNGSNSRMIIKSGGNVLIGTTTDAGYKVNIDGSLRTTFNTFLGTANALTIINNTANVAGTCNFQVTGKSYFSDAIVIGTTSPNASALLDVSSTTKGFLPPRMTGAQAEAIATPAAGLLVYANNGNGTTITSTGWWGYDGTTWVKLN